MLCLVAGVMVACGEDDPVIGPENTVASSSTGEGAATNGVGGATAGQGGASTTGTGSTAPGLGYENGTRLRARVFNGSDGSREFDVWHDSARGEDCTFRTASDGTLRCMPAASYSPYFAAGSNCGTPIYYHSQPTGTCVPVADYLEAPIGNVCNSPSLHARGAMMVSPANVMYRSNAVCVTIAAPNLGVYYALGAALPPSEFVEATSDIE